MNNGRKVSSKKNIMQLFITLAVIAFVSFNNSACRSIFHPRSPKPATVKTATTLTDTVPRKPGQVANSADSSRQGTDSVKGAVDSIGRKINDTSKRTGTDTIGLKVSA